MATCIVARWPTYRKAFDSPPIASGLRLYSSRAHADSVKTQQYLSARMSRWGCWLRLRTTGACTDLHVRLSSFAHVLECRNITRAVDSVVDGALGARFTFEQAFAREDTNLKALPS